MTVALPTSEYGSNLVDLTTPPKVADAQAYEALGAGAEYVDPQGQRRRKPFKVTDAASYDSVPEGMYYTDPDGALRQKPSYGGIDFTAQTLYDMAVTDKEKFNALARSYGKDRVKKDERTGKIYVQTEDGKLLAPGHGSLAKRAGAYAASEAAPLIGSVGGALGGGFVGTMAAPVAGTAAGAVAGAAAGGAAGQGFNDMVMGLAGVYDRTAGEEATNLGIAAASSAAGEGVGRVAAAGLPMAKDAARSALKAIPRAAAKFLGADKTPEAAKTAAELAAQGVRVPISGWAPESPYLKKVVEQFDPAFRQQNVLQQSAQKHYETQGSKILDELGIPSREREPLTAATAPVSSKEAGEAVLAKARGDLAERDRKLAESMQTAKEAIAAKAGNPEAVAAERQKIAASLAKEQEQNMAAARSAIDQGFKEIQENIAKAGRAAKSNENPGDLMRQAADAIRSLNKAVKRRARIMYDAADAAAGGEKPALGSLPADAKAFLEQLPEDFRSKYPDLVQSISEMQEGSATAGQLHHLRSILRSGVDYNNLSPGVNEGALKLFAHKVDNVIHAQTSPGLKASAKLLDNADAFYAKEMPRFRDETVKGIVTALKAGMPADAKTLADMVLQPGQAERISEIRKIVGPTLWSAVQAADTQSMIDAAKTLVPGQINGVTFAGKILDRVQNGIIEAGYDKETAKKLLQQAQRVMMAEGKLNIAVSPGDPVAQILKRAEDAKLAQEALAKSDPLGTIKRDLAEVEKTFAKDKRAAEMADPLRFLNNASAGAIASADRILKSPDLIIAAAQRFGQNSQEFTLIRQVYAHRLLQRSIGDAGKLAKEFSEEITPEVQAIMFPGTTLGQAQKLAHEMNFLLGGAAANAADTGGTMAAASRVLHPTSSMAFGLKFKVPGIDPIARYALGKYYALVSGAVTSPAFVQWVVKGLDGPPAARDMVRREVIKRLGNIGGAVGAGAGEAIGQAPINGDGQASTGVSPGQDWRKEYQATYGRAGQ